MTFDGFDLGMLIENPNSMSLVGVPGQADDATPTLDMALAQAGQSPGSGRALHHEAVAPDLWMTLDRGGIPEGPGAVASGFEEWDEIPDDTEVNNQFGMALDTFSYMGFNDLSINPVNPWDLGINPLVPDGLENWWYGRTPDGSGGAWSHSGNTWQYWDANGDLRSSYEETSQNDPAVDRTLTFHHNTTSNFSFGPYSRQSESGTSTTIYLRPTG